MVMQLSTMAFILYTDVIKLCNTVFWIFTGSRSIFAVINALSRRYFLQANDVTDMREWVAALNRASKITVSGTHTDTHTHSVLRRYHYPMCG